MHLCLNWLFKNFLQNVFRDQTNRHMNLFYCNSHKTEIQQVAKLSLLMVLSLLFILIVSVYRLAIFGDYSFRGFTYSVGQDSKDTRKT